MGEYRMVTRHVRYWRGAVHRWSKVYPFTGTASSADFPAMIAAMHALEQAVCYPSPSGVGGGCWEIVLYNSASGGVPVSVASYFDPATPGSWVPYDGSAWPDTTHLLETAAEVALDVRWQAGLSSSGKPVFFRKWSHAVPISAAAPGSQDIATGTRTALANAHQTNLSIIGGHGLLLGRGGRLAATTPVIDPDYGNHQMPRGRRRIVHSAARPASSFPPGLLVVPGSDDSLSV